MRTAKCPMCHAEIDHLSLLQDVHYRAYLVNGKLMYSAPEENDATDFKCPKCGEIIAEDEDEAEYLLLYG